MAEPSVIDRVRKALGRTGALTAAPTPPEILEPCARLVHSDIGLPELFASRAAGNKMHPETVGAGEVAARVVAFFVTEGVKRIAMPVSAGLEKLGIATALKGEGLEVKTGAQIT